PVLNQHSLIRAFTLAGSEPTENPSEPTQNRRCWFSKTQWWRGLEVSEPTEPTEPAHFYLYRSIESVLILGY
ncbi:hypothetical protein, partial [Enterobacter hormaechei]|uniref:hypothetical protein n=1 Tax=Enterobacter hormaechei TaxID=158836 RepID=UPI003A980945